MKKRVNGLFFVGIAIAALTMYRGLAASSAPYIPSYDDRYQDDLKQAQANKDYFKEPEDGLNYAQYRYVGAHAAEKYPRFFSEYVLQQQPLPGMFAIGVRGLMLSLYDWSMNWSSIVRQGVSVVCSHPMQETLVFRKNGKPLYQTLHYEMNRIFNFLKSHPKAVVTVWFEDQATMGKVLRDMQEIIKLNKYDPILRPSDWPNAQQKGQWPTLGWMRSKNKRLVLFTQNHDNHTTFTWPAKYYFWENNYGSIEPSVMCSEEKESRVEPRKRNRSLVSFGCYGAASISPGARNSRLCFEYGAAKTLTQSCQKRRFARGNLFNAYWTDHIINATDFLIKEKRKTVFDYVNELNASVHK